MKIEIWSVGRDSEAFIAEGLEYYFKKIRPYHPIELAVLQLPKKSATQDKEKAMREEEDMVLKRLQPHHYLVVLDERGKQPDSVQWSKQLQQMMNTGVKTLVILVGGAYGVTDNVKTQAKQVWSLSSLVFPHQLVRLIVAEQVYRAISILNNLPYHHS